MKHYSTLLLMAAFAACTGATHAQTNGSNSPYSRYGFGLLNDGALGFNKGMSGLSQGMRNGRELNAANPASYSAIDSLSFLFDIGISLQNANLDASGVKTNAKNTSFDYLTMGFRASRNLGMSVGLLPYSSIGYTLSRTHAVSDGTLTQTETYSGNGGLHEVYAGLGWRAFKGLSVGANIGYLWGGLTHTGLIAFSETSANSSRIYYDSDIRTYKADFGLQFEQRLNKKNNLTLGVTYGLGHDINSDAYYYRQTLTSGSVSAGDTLKASNAFQLPHTVSVGLAWSHNNRLRVGADYTFQKWSDVKHPVFDGLDYTTRQGQFSDMHKVVVGCEYMPDPNGVRWRQHVRYRAGFSYSTPYTKIDGADGPADYCASIGVGLPIINILNNRSILNVSAQYERVNPKSPGMITENYLRLCIGISFNERWFMKWKVQ